MVNRFSVGMRSYIIMAVIMLSANREGTLGLPTGPTITQIREPEIITTEKITGPSDMEQSADPAAKPGNSPMRLKFTNNVISQDYCRN